MRKSMRSNGGPTKSVKSKKAPAPPKKEEIKQEDQSLDFNKTEAPDGGARIDLAVNNENMPTARGVVEAE